MKFSRGYKPVREKVSKGSKYTMSCYNCEYYYQELGDKEEMCQNPNVLKYDMVITQTSIYCNRWKMCRRKSASTFKGGKELNGRKKTQIKKTGKHSS